MRDSIIFNGTVVGDNCVVGRAIVDKNVIIGADSVVGNLDGDIGKGEAPWAGITVVGKWNEIDGGAVIRPGSVVPLAEPRFESVTPGVGEAMTE